MSANAIRSGIQSTIQALAEFADADVVLNDWRVLDGEIASAPYFNIETASTFDDTMGTRSGNTDWEIPAELFVPFTEWTTSMNAIETNVQAILNTFRAVGTARSAGGIEAVDIHRVRSQGPVTPYYDKDTRPEDLPYATPIYLSQRMIFYVRDGWG